MLRISSPSFGHGGSIPRNHTADGADLAPPLAIEGVPPGTKSLALIVEDPDAPDPAAPQRIFVHWIVYDMQPSTRSLPLGADRDGLPAGSRQGRNDFGVTGYGGPAPPVGRHRYLFRLFALDTRFGERLGHPRRADVMTAMDGHVIEEAEVMGTYERERAESQPIL
jgi:Raf kinase inhibitor-like YbhB/YbcL family protein